MGLLDVLKSKKVEKLSDSIEDKDLKAAVVDLENSLAATQKAKETSEKKVPALQKDLDDLKKENQALKIATELEGEVAEQEVVKLSEKERTFEVTLEDPDGKNKKKVKAMLIDTPKIYVSGRKYTQEQFLEDKEAQKTAVACKHPLIKIN